MPGIAGVFAPAPSPIYEQQVRRMVSALCHSPDCETGTAMESELGVYAGWLAHGASFAARHSTTAADTPVALALAGECFGPDTSPAGSLVRQYLARGGAFISGLNGLFAGLLIDRRRRRAVLFNDRYGSERLYTATQDGATYFASEAKALLAVLPRLRVFDATGVAQFVAFGSTLDGRTLFRDLSLIPGGSVWTCAVGADVRRDRYFVPGDWEALPELTESEFQSRFCESFSRLLPEYLRDERAVGLSLTAGLDTRMIVACTPRDMQPAVAYTYAAADSDRLRDLTIARRIAAGRGMDHHALRIDAGFLADFGQHLDRTVWLSDGTAGVLGAHELVLSEQARRLAPVRLTGNFGSEVLRSMSTLKRAGHSDDFLDPTVAALVGKVVAEQQARVVHPVTYAAFEEVPWHLCGTLAVSRSQLSVRTPYLDNRIVELAYRAPPRLRRTPAPALRLIYHHDPALASQPTDRGVAWGSPGVRNSLRRLVADATFKLDYWHKEGLPDRLSPLGTPLEWLSYLGLLGQHKFLAYRQWFRDALAPYAAQVTADVRTRSLPFWNASVLGSIAQDHAAGRCNRLGALQAVLTLEAVHRLLIDGDAWRNNTQPK